MEDDYIPQDGDLADGPNGEVMVYRAGAWHPADANGRPLSRIPRPDYGDNHFELPNGDIVRAGPRGGEYLVERGGSGTGGSQSGGTLVGADTRGRYQIGVDSMIAAEGRLQGAEAGGVNPMNEDWGAVVLDGIGLDLPGDNDVRPFGPLARWIGGEDYQSYTQALATYEASLMPIMSGASVTPSEARRMIRADFPSLLDTPETLQLKAQNRMRRINAVLAGLGRDPVFSEEQIAAGTGTMQDEIAAFSGGSQSPDGPAASLPTLPGFGGGNGTEPPGSPNNPFNYDALDLNQRQALPLGAHIASRNEDGTYRLSQFVRAGFTDTPPEGAIQRADGTYEVRRDRGMGEAAAFASGAAEQIPFGDEIAAGIVGTLTGEGYGAIRQFDRQQDEIDRAIFGGSRNAGGITGGATGLLLPGGQIMNGTRGVNALARGAGLGAGYGALYGAGAAEDGERLSGAVEGGVVGGITGGLAEPVGAVFGRVGTAAGRTVDGWTGGRLGEMVNSLTGGRVGGADNGARARMIEALRRDGYDGPALQNLLQRWQQNGGTDAALIDLVTQNGGGQNFMSLVRASALRGGGASAAARQYRGAVEGGATDEALNLTRGLTPDNRSAPQVRDDLVQDRSRMADQQYREPYRTVVSEEILPDPANRPPPVDPFEWFDPAEGQALIGGTPQPRNTLPPNVRRVLEDSEGARAVGVAMRAAIANSDDDLVRQLRALRQGDDSVPITARALDRIRIAFREMAEGAAADQRGSLAAGLRDRVDRLDGVLDDLPELRDARAAYRAASQRIEGVDLGAGAYSRSPGELTDQLTRSPAARDTFGLGLARDIEGAIGRQGDGATGLFNRLATAPNSRNALAQAFGPERGAQYQNALGQIVDRVRTARAIDPGFGSQTAQRGMDALIEGVAPISGGILTGIMRKLNEGLALTDAEREIVVRYATSMPDINVLAQRFAPSRAVLPRPLLGAQVGSQSQ